MNILTIIVVAFLTIVTVRGFVRGFSRSVLSILLLQRAHSFWICI